MIDEISLQSQWESLTIQDNFIFGKTMELNPEICRRLIEIILQIKVARISYPEREKTIDARIDSKGVRLDVYAEGDNNRSFDLEMQVSNTHDLLKRTRYYQGLIDLEKLKRGEHYNALGESYIIFICPFKLFGQDQHIYIWQTKCINNSAVTISDGVTKIFLSTKGKTSDISPALRNFLDYVDRAVVADDFTKELDAAVKIVKTSEKVRLRYMTYQMALLESRMEGHEEGIKEGIARGMEQGLALGVEQIAVKMLRYGKSLEEIHQLTELPLQRIQELAKEG